MDIRPGDLQKHPFPQPAVPPQPQPLQVRAPMIYVYEPQAWEYKIIVKKVPEEELLSQQELNEWEFKVGNSSQRPHCRTRCTFTSSAFARNSVPRSCGALAATASVCVKGALLSSSPTGQLVDA